MKLLIAFFILNVLDVVLYARYWRPSKVLPWIPFSGYYLLLIRRWAA